LESFLVHAWVTVQNAPVEQPSPEWSQQYYLGGVVEIDGRTSAFLVHRVTGEVSQVILGYDDPSGLRLMSVDETSSPFGVTVAVEMAGQIARISTLQEEPQPAPVLQPKPEEIKQPPTSPADKQPLADDPWPLKPTPSRYVNSPAAIGQIESQRLGLVERCRTAGDWHGSLCPGYFARSGGMDWPVYFPWF